MALVGGTVGVAVGVGVVVRVGVSVETGSVADGDGDGESDITVVVGVEPEIASAPIVGVGDDVTDGEGVESTPTPGTLVGDRRLGISVRVDRVTANAGE